MELFWREIKVNLLEMQTGVSDMKLTKIATTNF